MESHCDSEYVTRLFLSELVARGDSRAAAILELLSGDALEDRLAGPAHGACRAAIAVCTAKRPKMLHHCLQSIASQIVASQVSVDVVVVDNEGEPNNLSLVKEFSARCRFPVHYMHEPRQGIPQARNAALEKCLDLGADWIAFTDDDCWVSPTWLADLLDAARRHDADVVYGRREFLFPKPLPFWAMRPEQGTYAEGEALPYAATHNVLFAARLVSREGACAFRGRRPLVPAHGDHLFQAMATGVARGA